MKKVGGDMESIVGKAADRHRRCTSRGSHSNQVRTYEWRDLEQTIIDNQVKWTVYLPSKDIVDCGSGDIRDDAIMEICNSLPSKDCGSGIGTLNDAILETLDISKKFGSKDIVDSGCGSAMEISNSPTSTLTADTDHNNVSMVMSDHDLDHTFQSSALAFQVESELEVSTYLGPLAIVGTPVSSDGPYPAFDLQELRSSSSLPMISPEFEASTEDCNSCDSDVSENQWPAAGDLASFDGMVFQDSSNNAGPNNPGPSELERLQETCEMFKVPVCEMFKGPAPPTSVAEQNYHLPIGQDVEIEQQQISAASNLFKGNVEEVQDNQDCGVELVHELWACALAIARGELVAAQQHVEQLTRLMSPKGSTMERVATYFTEALRIRAWQSGEKVGYHDQDSANAYDSSPRVRLQHTWFAYQVFYRACPYLIVTHFAANQAILEAFEGEEKVHIVDLDIKLGLQWPSLIQALSERPRGPPQLRITVVAGSSPDYLEGVMATRNRLLDFADMYSVPLEYNIIEEDVENLQPWSLKIRHNEALAVNSVTSLHQLIHHSRRSIDSFLLMILSLRPSVVTVVEEDANHDQEFFPRFQDALQYYSSMFDSIAASTLSNSLAEREMVERLLLGQDIVNIVGREGQERFARHQTAELWIQRMTKVGFRLRPLSTLSILQAKGLLEQCTFPASKYCLINQESYLSLGWHGNPLYSVSCWC